MPNGDRWVDLLSARRSLYFSLYFSIYFSLYFTFGTGHNKSWSTMGWPEGFTMLMMTVKCVRIDNDSFQGRDAHPQERHIGQIFSVLSMVEECLDARGNANSSEDQDKREYLAMRDEVLSGKEDAGFVFKVLTCVAADGEIVQFVDYEIEIVSVTLNGQPDGEASRLRTAAVNALETMPCGEKKDELVLALLKAGGAK